MTFEIYEDSDLLGTVTCAADGSFLSAAPAPGREVAWNQRWPAMQRSAAAWLEEDGVPMADYLSQYDEHCRGGFGLWTRLQR
jgi:hypothetical protein